MEAGRQPEHRSYSQLHLWLECGKHYLLERLLHVPSRPGVPYASGQAYHATIERYLLSQCEGDK